MQMKVNENEPPAMPNSPIISKSFENYFTRGLLLYTHDPLYLSPSLEVIQYVREEQWEKAGWLREVGPSG